CPGACDLTLRETKTEGRLPRAVCCRSPSSPARRGASRRLGSPLATKGEGKVETNFRLYDNRQKYLMFVNTCSEKWVIAERVVAQVDRLDPVPPALRFFDAGVGDGTVLARALRGMRRRFERVPLFVCAKEIS